MQYLFRSWNSRGPQRYRDMLLDVGTEEMAHVEMYATAIALNLEGAAGQNRRWTEGKSMDGRGEFHEIKAQPYGQEPQLAPPMPIGHAQTEQMEKASQRS